MEAIYYDWSTSSWGALADSEGKNGAGNRAADPPSTRNARRHSKTSRTIRKTHTSDTRESLRLDGIISGSLFPFRVLLKLRLASAPGCGHSRLFRIRFIHDCGFEWIRNVRFLPTSRSTSGYGRATPARVAMLNAQASTWREHSDCYGQQNRLTKTRQWNNVLV